MAKNIIQPAVGRPLDTIRALVTYPTTVAATPVPAAGDPVAVGLIPGIAETNPDTDSPYLTTVRIGPCIAEIPVLGDDGAGSIVVVGDKLWIGSTGVVSKLNTGKAFGVAYGAAQGANSLNPTRTGNLVSSG